MYEKKSEKVASFRWNWFVSGPSSQGFCIFVTSSKFFTWFLWHNRPWKLTWLAGKSTVWRCIPYWKWWIFHCHESPQVLPKHPRSHHEQQDLGGWRDGSSGVQKYFFFFGWGREKKQAMKVSLKWGWYFEQLGWFEFFCSFSNARDWLVVWRTHLVKEVNVKSKKK